MGGGDSPPVLFWRDLLRRGIVRSSPFGHQGPTMRPTVALIALAALLACGDPAGPAAVGNANTTLEEIRDRLPLPKL